MKPEIHPEFTETEFKCACGATHKTRSTMGGSHRIDICSACHPFYTGKQKIIDVAGRVERFQRRYGKKVTKPVDQQADS